MLRGVVRMRTPLQKGRFWHVTVTAGEKTIAIPPMAPNKGMSQGRKVKTGCVHKEPGKQHRLALVSVEGCYGTGMHDNPGIGSCPQASTYRHPMTQNYHACYLVPPE